MLSADSSISKKPLTSSFHVSHDNSNSTLSSLQITSLSNHTQRSFINQHDQKAALRKLNESNKLKRKSFRSDPERMWNLRMKFVKQAKKYLGIPYAKKYFSHDSPEYHSKLFLDCCGLVRKVMRDLEDDFGFRIGGGNQAYHFDTLPGEVKRLEDVKPGDLVFMSGIYNTHRLKVQPHNITHVEIMLGDGSEKTIGSRWNNGTVSIFDSYKFMSKSFHSEKYYIKSIDPWLWGYCRSYCPKHSWAYNITLPKNRKSIFYSEHEANYRAKLKRELAVSREYKKINESKLNSDSKKKKLKKRKKKLKSVTKTKITQNIKVTSLESKTSTTMNSNGIIDNRSVRTEETFCKSEYEFQSESESDFNSGVEVEENSEISSDESSEVDSQDAHTKVTDNKSIVESELNENYSRNTTVLSDDEDNEEINKVQYYRGGSNMAQHNSESQYDLSSLSDNFYYENFQPQTRSSKLNTQLGCTSSHQDQDNDYDREIEATEENEGVIVGGYIEGYNECNDQRFTVNSENNYDDNNDVECSTLSFKLLKLDKQ